MGWLGSSVTVVRASVCRGPVSLAAFRVVVLAFVVAWEVFVVVPWVLGAGGALAGFVLVGVAERATRAPLALSGRGRAAMAGAVSVVTGVLWVVGWWRFGMTAVLLAWCWACALGCSLVITDVRCRRLPFPLVAAFVGGGLVVLFGAAVVEGRWLRFGFACAAGVVVCAMAGLVQVWVPEHTGGGDTALYGAVAVYVGWFGWEGLLRGLLAASGLTAVVALVVAVCSQRLDARFPAGPSLLAGAMGSLLFA